VLLPTLAPLSAFPPLTTRTLTPTVIHYYFAGGENSTGTRSTLSLLNPGLRPADALLTFYFADGTVRNTRVSVNPYTMRAVPVSALIDRNEPFGLQVASALPVAAQLTLDQPGRDGDTIAPATATDKTWYLAEGYTGLTFHESAALLNPGDRAARVTLHLLSFDGRAARSVLVTVAPHAQAVVNVNRLLSGRAAGLIATSDQGVVVESPEYSGSPNAAGIAGSDAFGQTTGAARWSFAAGAAGGLSAVSEFFLLYNPSANAISVSLVFYDAHGMTATRHVVVAAHARATLDLRRLAPSVIGMHGVTLTSMNGQKFVVEQTVFTPNVSTLRTTQGLAQP